MESSLNKVKKGIKEAQELSALPSQRYAEELEKEKATKNPYAEGSRYFDLYNKNPYTMQSFHGRETAWDNLASALGFKSGYEAQLEDWLRARDEYNAQVEQLKGEDEYSSEQAKAQRLREAGINPDLQGISEASNAAEFAMDATGPEIRSNNESAERIIGVIGAIPKAITFAMGITQDISKTMGLIYDNDTKRISNGEKMMNLAKSFMEAGFTNDADDDTTRNGPQEFSEAREWITDEAYNWAIQNGFSKRKARKFQTNVYNVFTSDKENWYNKKTNILKAKKEYGITHESKFTTDSDDPEKIMKIAGDLSNEMDETLENGIKAEKAKSKADREYWENKSGQLQAEGENAENEMKKGKGAILGEARKAMQKAMKKLEKACKEGNVLAIALNSALATIQLKFLE